MKGDEIMVINGAIVSDLDMMFIESVLQEELTLCMMLRSARTGIGVNKQLMIMMINIFSKKLIFQKIFTDPPVISALASGRNVDMIESLVCPPPPTDNSINEDPISSLIVPAPGKRKA